MKNNLNDLLREIRDAPYSKKLTNNFNTMNICHK